MKANRHSNLESEMPASAQRAFDGYPRLTAPNDFNRRVLLALEARQIAQKTTLLGRIEAFLGLPLAQFIGSGALGAFFPLLILSAMCLSSRGVAPPIPEKPDTALWLRFYGPFFGRERFGSFSDVV